VPCGPNVPNDDNRHIRLVGEPVTLSRTPSKIAAPPPEFGEQTDEVLSEFGFSSQEITELRQAKVV
jgi:crotonobetainyl-CoA:carnitine CoA-transferase CaiB-like acyl-CoA transferase